MLPLCGPLKGTAENKPHDALLRGHLSLSLEPLTLRAEWSISLAISADPSCVRIVAREVLADGEPGLDCLARKCLLAHCPLVSPLFSPSTPASSCCTSGSHASLASLVIKVVSLPMSGESICTDRHQHHTPFRIFACLTGLLLESGGHELALDCQTQALHSIHNFSRVVIPAALVWHTWVAT